MHDEFPSGNDEDEATNDGDDPEVPIVPHPIHARTKQHNPRKYARRAYRYAKITYSGLTTLLNWLWKWVKVLFVSANFWIAGATVLIAISTIVYTHYARKQWEVMNRQLLDSESVERAHLVIKDYSGAFIKLPGYQVSTIKVTFSLTNVGRSVATNINVGETCGFSNRPSEVRDKIKLDISPLPSGPSLGQGDTKPYMIDCTSSGVENALVSKEFFRHVVQVGYRTIFGTSGVLSDCLIYDATSKTFESCPAEKQD